MLCPVPDTNILLHARKLETLPWGDIESEHVEIILVGPTLREIDKHKTKPGRIGKRAKEVSAEIRETLKMPGRSRLLREASPRVTMTIVPGIGVSEALHDCLDLEHPDHALVNHALWLVHDGRPAILLTNDTLASLVAEEVGLEVMLVPDSWLLEPEPDETEKRLKRALGEIEELKRQEPQIRARLVDHDKQPLDRLKAKVRRYPALDPEMIEALLARAQALCPIATFFGPRTFEEAAQEEEERRRSSPFAKYGMTPVLPAMFKRVFEPASAQAIGAYQNETYPDWLSKVRAALEAIHERLDRSIDWPSFSLELGNDGTRPAEGTLVEVTARGRLQLKRHLAPPKGAPKPQPWLPRPPSPPRGRLFQQPHFSRIHELAAGMRLIDDPLRHPDVFDMIAPPDPAKWVWSPKRGEASSRITISCGKWRHQSSMPPNAIYLETGETEGDVRGAVDLRVRAHNLSRPVTMTLPVEIEIVVGNTAGFAKAHIDDLPKYLAAGDEGDRTNSN